MNQDLKNRITEIVQNTADELLLLKQLKTLIDESDMSNHTYTDTKPLSYLYNESLESLQSNHGQKDLIKSQFASLDELIGGFIPGEFVVIGARPSVGKTQILINLCLNFSNRLPVLYFSFDLSDNLLTKRFISTLSSIPINRILQGDLISEEKKQLSSYDNYFSEHKIFVNGGSISSLAQFRDQCLEQINNNGVKVIIVDFYK